MTRARARALLVLAALLSGHLVGCGQADKAPRQLGTAATQSKAKQLLIQELRRQAAASPFSFVVDSTSVKYELVSSAVIPGASYEWVFFQPRDVFDVNLAAVAAIRDTSVAIVRSANDWWRVIQPWQPGSAQQSRDACLEGARLMIDPGPKGPATVFDPAHVQHVALAPGDSATLSRLIRDTTRILPPATGRRQWVVDMWVVSPTLRRLATHVRCVLPTVRSDSVQLVALDSIVGGQTAQPE